MERSKSANVLRSTLFGCIYNIIQVLLGLISRKLFLQYLGIEYLSVAQIINSFLMIYSLSELGVQNAVLFLLYRYIAENNTEGVQKIMAIYRKCNHYIGLAVFVIGVVCMPFFLFFIETDISTPMLCTMYLLNLLYASGSYFFSYRTVLLSAQQKDYIYSILITVTSVISVFVQCSVILLIHNYLLYLVTLIVFGMLSDIVVFLYVGKKMPYVRNIRTVPQDKELRRELREHVKATFTIKICGTVIDNTDNILVSLFDTLMVGFCSNYTSITVRMKWMLTSFQMALLHSLGIASAERSREEQYQLFKKIKLLNTFLAGVLTVPLGVLWDDFIMLWLGQEYTISSWIVCALLLNFCSQIFDATIWLFRDATGMFVHVKKMLIANALLNLGLSALFGSWMGIAGVYLATTVSNLMTNFWYDTKVIYEKVFARHTYKQHLLYVIANISADMLLIYGLRYFLGGIPNTLLLWICKGAISVGVYCILFRLVYGMREEYKGLKEMIKTVVRRK